MFRIESVYGVFKKLLEPITVDSGFVKAKSETTSTSVHRGRCAPNIGIEEGFPTFKSFLQKNIEHFREDSENNV